MAPPDDVSADETAWRTARSLRDSLYGDLVWSLAHAMRIVQRDLVLESGSERLALLRREKLFRLEVIAVCADGRWRISRQGIGRRANVVVRDAATDAPVATFTRHWRGPGEVQFESGARYAWGRSGFLRAVWFWSQDSDTKLIAYSWVVSFKRLFTMEVDPGAHRRAELPVLVLLGAYLMMAAAGRQHAH